MYFSSQVVVATLLSVAQAIDVHVVAVGKNPMTNETAQKYFPDRITAKPGDMVQFQFWAGNHTVTQSSFDEPCMPLGMSASGETATGGKTSKVGSSGQGARGSQSGTETGMAETGMAEAGMAEAGMEEASGNSASGNSALPAAAGQDAESEAGMAGSSSNKATLKKLGARATNSSMSGSAQGKGAMTGIFSSFMPVAASMSMGQIPVFTIMINDTKPVWIYCGQARHCQNGMVMVINENTQANPARSLEAYKAASEKAPSREGSAPGGSSGSPGSTPGGSSGSPGSTPGGETGGETGRTGETSRTGEGSASETGTTSEGATRPGQTSALPISGASSISMVPATMMLALSAAFMLL
ncbi:hypothetical protein CDD81_1138 [Ophiocordyceps australis]|uniref:Phytocyanin domain-containing protein n=1 Tax=Ophiocordyceps australis TaxID=1399860 RepID=A0A2C5XWF7_9HYPO|nr:hypothetical protein CDD81_1138 [Ophiocordyceps australis]